MTKALDAMLERVHRLSQERQDEIASLLGKLVDLDVAAAGRLTDAHWAEIDRRVEGPARFASDEQVAAFFRSSLA